MKKIWILPLVVLWIFAVYQMVHASITDEAKVVEVLGNVGTEDQTSVVEYYGTYTEGYLEKDERSAFLKNIAKELGITDNVTITRITEDGREETKLSKKSNGGETILRLVTNTQDNTRAKATQYIIANLSLYSGMDQALGYRQKLNKILEPQTKDIKSSANIIGSYDGELSLKNRNRVADAMLSELGASVVTEHRDEKLFTILGYTPRISEYKMQENEAVNVNIAMYYSSDKDKTYVYAAIPVLGLDYQ